MNKALPYILAAVLGLSCTQALAQSQAEGQQACGNDAFALCSDAIPDANRIAACLSRNFSRVSAPCRAYMASYGKSHRATRHASRRYEERYGERWRYRHERYSERRHHRHERYSERRHHRHEHYSERHHRRHHHRSHGEG
jgi:hypothetical protein